MRTYLTLLLLPLLLLNCGGVKPATGGKATRYFTTFYTGAETGTQYFIKPLSFRAEDGAELTLDVTFREGRFAQDSATLNYTVVANTQLPDRLPLAGKGKSNFVTTDIDRLFQERLKQQYSSRYTSHIPNPDFLGVFNDPDLLLVASIGGREITFRPTTKTANALAEIRYSLLSLYD